LPALTVSICGSFAALFFPYLFKSGILPQNPILLALWASVARPLFVIGFGFGLYTIYHQRLRKNNNKKILVL
jgi:hypothetical protein